MSSPFAYVLNDADYQAASASLGSQYMEKIICFDVKDTEHSYNFAKALQMEYVRHTSSLSDFMGNYDAWEDRTAQENERLMDMPEVSGFPLIWNALLPIGNMRPV